MPDGYQESDSRVEVPLRIPLDPESRLNRKLAKQIYNTEKQEKLKQARQTMIDEHLQQEEAKLKKQKKLEKKVQVDRKERAELFKVKLEKDRERREKASTNYKKDKLDFEMTLREK